MTDLDDELIPAAAELLTDLGKTISIEEVTKSHAESTGVVTVTVVGTHSVKAAPPFSFNRKLVDGDAIRDDDLQTIIAAQGLTFTPEIGWKVTIDSVVWKILRVMPLYSGESVAAYQLHLRR